MNVVFDSSAFAKRYIAESGSEQVDEILQNAAQLGLSALCVPEIVSALNRRVREGVLPHSRYEQAKAQLVADVADAIVLQLTLNVVATAVTLLESHPLRAMDALHIAGALVWRADLFVTADRRQHDAAQQSGLNTQLV
ncbi:MAG: type II toxin-antitoxin system VapC family toxin [Chloroflexota bacterium]